MFAAQGAEESYFNINKAIAGIELDKIKYKFDSNLKCLSLVIGINPKFSSNHVLIVRHLITPEMVFGVNHKEKEHLKTIYLIVLSGWVKRVVN